MSDDTGYQATPHAELLAQILDPRVPKNEREWAAAREIEKLTAERDLLEKDAQRYRWLRDSGDAGCIAPHTYWERGCSGETLDKHIDAAMDHANRDE